jgi:hypothetical protein
MALTLPNSKRSTRTEASKRTPRSSTSCRMLRQQRKGIPEQVRRQVGIIQRTRASRHAGRFGKATVQNLDVSVEVWASPDLQHEKGDANWSDAGTYYCQMPFHPNVNFWFLRCPGFGYYLTNLDRGKWTKIHAHFRSPRAGSFDHFEFHVPIGTGFILLRNFSVSPAN